MGNELDNCLLISYLLDMFKAQSMSKKLKENMRVISHQIKYNKT